ncbi:apoptosis-inducing factor 1, mitochondrial-like [Plutella xylostella]|uniref:apoptosis-inducing factor 1, mitochondrial-like n=1 Tax=Plutella xylostella TaxID=51655 RepID=UPI00203276BE|nr:apoptosis-inducing factor 1, mitochondrial-like [Plutella xylostella]
MRPLLGVPFKYSIKFLSSNIVSVRRPDVSYFGHLRNKSDKCCKDVSQTEGKKVEVWPRPEGTLKGYKMNRSSTPEDQPPNYDPYRIKMPNVVVPPLPPSNAKPAIECARTKGPCAAPPHDTPPPCPPPPRKQFPWRYLLPPLLFAAFMGLLYKFILWRNKVIKEQEYQAGQISGCVKTKMRPPTPAEDLPACVQYLIIGAGTAGWAAYQAIRKHDPTAKVFFVTRENTYPYDLPPLSKYMWFNPGPPDITALNYTVNGKQESMYTCDCKDFLDPARFARHKGPAVSIALGCAAAAVDADEHVATVKTGAGERQVYYERCLLAPGSKPRQMEVFKSAPRDVRNKVTYLRTIKDFDAAYKRVKRAKHVTVVGGGILGSELAYYLGASHEQQGSSVTSFTDDDEDSKTEFLHIFKDKGILSGIIPEYLSEWAAERIKCPHVKTKPLTQVYDAYPTEDGRVELALSDGTTVITDHIFASVGHVPRTEVAAASGLEVGPDGGILVNAEMMARTHLFVAGDAASYYNQKKDMRMRCEHYDNALQSGAVAGANMTGYWTVNNAESHWWFKLGDHLKMEVIGDVGACMPTIGIWKQCESEERDSDTDDKPTDKAQTHRACYQDPNYEARYEKGIIFYLEEETIVGVALWNIPPIDNRRDVVTEILQSRPSYKDISDIADTLGFPAAECSVYERRGGAERGGGGGDQATADQQICITNKKVW